MNAVPDHTAIRTALWRALHLEVDAPPPVLERWTGTYASAAGHSLIEAPLPGVRLVTVTGGTGASTAFGLAEEVIAGLYPQGVVA